MTLTSTIFIRIYYVQSNVCLLSILHDRDVHNPWSPSSEPHDLVPCKDHSYRMYRGDVMQRLHTRDHKRNASAHAHWLNL